MKSALALLETLEQDSLGTHPQARACLGGVAALAAAVGLFLVRGHWPVLVWNDSPAGALDLGVAGVVFCLGIVALVAPPNVVFWIARRRLRAEVRDVRVAVDDVSAPTAIRETGPIPVPPSVSRSSSRAAQSQQTGPLSLAPSAGFSTGSLPSAPAPAPVRAGRSGPLAYAPVRSGRTGSLGTSTARAGQTGPLSLAVPPPPPSGTRLRGLKRLAAVRAKSITVSEALTLFALLGPSLFAYLFMGGTIRMVVSILFGVFGLGLFMALHALWHLRGFTVTVDDRGFVWRPSGKLRRVRASWSEVRAVCRTTLNVSEDGSRQSIYMVDTPTAVLIWSIARPPSVASAGFSGSHTLRSQRASASIAPTVASASATSGERLLRYALLYTGLPLRDLSKLIGAPAPRVPHHVRAR